MKRKIVVTVAPVCHVGKPVPEGSFNPLTPEEIGVELVVAKQVVGAQSPDVTLVEQLQLVNVEGTQATYALDVVPSRTGAFDIALRVYPKNANLPYRMDFALVKWA